VTERGFEIYEDPERTVEDMEKSWELLVDAQNESAVVGEDSPSENTIGMESWKNPDGQELHVHFDHLHRHLQG
jgi:hypothetical protein